MSIFQLGKIENNSVQPVSCKRLPFSDFTFQRPGAAPPSEEDESFLTCYLTAKFVHHLRREIHICRLSHLCIFQELKIPIHCDPAKTGISDMECCSWKYNVQGGG